MTVRGEHRLLFWLNLKLDFRFRVSEKQIITICITVVQVTYVTAFVGFELSKNLPAILCFHSFMMIPLHVSTFHWQFTTKASASTRR